MTVEQPLSGGASVGAGPMGSLEAVVGYPLLDERQRSARPPSRPSELLRSARVPIGAMADRVPRVVLGCDVFVSATPFCRVFLISGASWYFGGTTSCRRAMVLRAASVPASGCAGLCSGLTWPVSWTPMARANAQSRPPGSRPPPDPSLRGRSSAPGVACRAAAERRAMPLRSRPGG
jgi:hypothetical protein